MIFFCIFLHIYYVKFQATEQLISGSTLRFVQFITSNVAVMLSVYRCVCKTAQKAYEQISITFLEWLGKPKN